jgi:GR25 family glycosyltransferase involved in LPS biosynthesis
MIDINNINFFCINLENRTDRKNWISSHFENFGLSCNFYKAKNSNDNKYNLIFPNTYTSGRIGCFLSHYDLIKNYNDDKILGVFEDDAVLCEDFIDRFDYIKNNFDLEWDIFFLSSFYHLNDDSKRWYITGDYEMTNIKYIHRTYASFCTHSYLVNPKSIEKILSLMEKNLNKSYALDHLYIIIQPLMNTYSFTPGMVNQLESISDVDGRFKNQSIFEKICGRHYYINNLKNFEYDEYFSKDK